MRTTKILFSKLYILTNTSFTFYFFTSLITTTFSWKCGKIIINLANVTAKYTEKLPIGELI